MNRFGDLLIICAVVWIFSLVVQADPYKYKKKRKNPCERENLKLVFESSIPKTVDGDTDKRVYKCQQECNVKGEDIFVWGHYKTVVCDNTIRTCEERSSYFDHNICRIVNRKDYTFLDDKNAFKKVKTEFKKCDNFPENARQFKDTNHFSKFIEVDQDSKQIRLVHKMDFLTHCGKVINHNFISIDSGGKITSYDGLVAQESVNGYGGNNKIGIFRYGEAPWEDRQLLMKPKNDSVTCISENKYVTVASAEGKKLFPPDECFPPVKNIFETPCNTTGERKDGILQVNDALFWANQFVKMLSEEFDDTTLIDNCILPLKLCVMFRGTEGKSFFFNSGSCETYYSIADDDTHAMASPSIIGHELGHAIISFTSKLENREHSGAIADALADLFGLALKSSLDLFDTDWKYGNEVQKVGAIKYFENPTNDGNSIDHTDDYQKGMDVHFASGIYRRAMYILGNSRSWNFERVFRLFLYTNKFYWREQTTFTEGLCDLIRGAEDLGFLPGSVRILEESFSRVGLYCGCPDGWDQGKFGCYQYFEAEETWFDAELSCEVIGAQLLSIQSGKKFRSVKHYLQDVLGISTGKVQKKLIWIGGTKLRKNKWQWFPSGKKVFKRYQQFKNDGKDCIVLDKVLFKKRKKPKKTVITAQTNNVDVTVEIIYVDDVPDRESMPEDTVFEIQDEETTVTGHIKELQSYRLIGRAKNCTEKRAYICELLTFDVSL